MDLLHERKSQFQLLARARAGDLQAVRKFFGGCLAPVYDYALRLGADPETAARVTAAAMHAAAVAIREGATPAAVRERLFAAATAASLASEPVAAELGIDITAPVGALHRFQPAHPVGPAAVARDRDLAQLVWRAPLAAGRREYAALDLRHRRRFRLTAVARILGTTPEAAGALLATARGRLDAAVGTYLVCRYGAAECLQLARLRAEFSDSSWTSPQRRRLEAHLESCRVCRAARRAPAGETVDPVSLLAGLSQATPPPEFRRRLLVDLCLTFFPSQVIEEAPTAPPPATALPIAAAPLARAGNRARRGGYASAVLGVASILILTLAGGLFTTRVPPIRDTSLARTAPAASVSDLPATGLLPALDPAGRAAEPGVLSGRTPGPAPEADTDAANLVALAAALRVALASATVDGNAPDAAAAAGSGGHWVRIPAVN
jgi:hypothetical protein